MYHILPILASIVAVSANCPNYEQFARERHEPFSSGRHAYPFQRPGKDCRTYSVPAVEKVIYDEMDQAIGDPDLYPPIIQVSPFLQQRLSVQRERHRLPLPRSHKPPSPIYNQISLLQCLPSST
ncbi:hypothetical protein LB505_006317 [Fusarium chuoi]|nr:hypothetical protein LB505_006317 [Fusarium chuoi]